MNHFLAQITSILNVTERFEGNVKKIQFLRQTPQKKFFDCLHMIPVIIQLGFSLTLRTYYTIGAPELEKNNLPKFLRILIVFRNSFWT